MYVFYLYIYIQCIHGYIIYVYSVYYIYMVYPMVILVPCPASLDGKAPAKKLQEHGHALRLELEGSAAPATVLHKSTRTVLKGHLKNASRQYKRVVARFGFALKLSCIEAKVWKLISQSQYILHYSQASTFILYHSSWGRCYYMFDSPSTLHGNQESANFAPHRSGECGSGQATLLETK